MWSNKQCCALRLRTLFGVQPEPFCLVVVV